MGVMDKFLNAMKLNGDDEDLYDDEYYDDEEEIDEAPRKKVVKVDDAYDEEEDKPKVRSVPKVTPMRQTRKTGANGMEVCVIKPTSVEDAREITETLLENRTVVLNLEGLDVDIAQRIIDFTSGSCFAISGNLQKISHYIFIITPSSVDISGDFQDILNGSFEVPSLNNNTL
ncbi:MAG: cell division protein SepF [Lachnospiraceae bacterium]|nr:cell division protein SepF [Lachnospiraceae bacterium]